MSDNNNKRIGWNETKLTSVMESANDKINKVICPCATKAFNHVTDGGFRSGNLWLIGGSTGAGKTQWALSECVNAAKQGKRVLYITTEMDEDDIYERLYGVEMMDDTIDRISVRSLSCLTSLRQWEMQIMNDCVCDPYDLIFIDYINSATIQMPESLGVPDDQRIVVLTESLRRIIRGKTAPSDVISSGEWQISPKGRTYPCLIMLTQLNRLSGTAIPGANAVQGSFSASFKADLAANMVMANKLEREAVKDLDEKKSFMPPCTRMLYFYKNRNVNDISERLCWMSYDAGAISFHEIAHKDGYDIDWKALGRSQWSDK